MAQKKKTASMTPGLIARKGDARPASDSPPSPPVTPKKEKPRCIADTVAVTVRLDQKRYTDLKIFGATHRRTNQYLIIQALDEFLIKHTENP